MRTRTKISIVAFLFLAAIAVGYVALQTQSQKKILTENELQIENETVAIATEIEKFNEDIVQAKTYSEWEALRLRANELPSEARDSFVGIISAKALEARAWRRDVLLFYAAQILGVNSKDPVGLSYLEKAEELTELNIAELDEISERVDDCVWNSQLWYRKGLEYVRALIFVGRQEQGKALDLIEQARRNFRKALDCSPKDRRTEVAIELLYKESQSRNARGQDTSNSIQNQLRLLPSDQIGPPGYTDSVRPGDRI